MTARRKIVLIIFVLLAVLIVALGVIVPRLADIDRYRPEVIARLERGTGRSAAIGKLNLTVLPVLGIRADNVVIGNPRGFPAGNFLAVRHAYARLDAGALLHRRIAVRSLQLDSPELDLISDAAGRWNTQAAAVTRPRISLAAWQSAPAPAMVVSNVTIEHGRMTAANILPTGATGPISVDVTGISAELKDIDTQALGLHLSSTQFGAAPAEFVATASLWRPVPIGLVGAVLMQSMPPASPSGPLAAHGTISADSARFGAITVTGVKSGLEIYRDGVAAKNIVLQLFGGRVSGDLMWEPVLQPPRYTSHLDIAGVNVERALLSFPDARGKLTGTLEGKTEITGWTPVDDGSTAGDPLANLQGEGSVTIRNGSLPAIRLNRDLTLLMKNVVRTQSGSPDPSTFRSMSADFRIDQGEIRSRQIMILGNGIDLNVTGSVALAGAGKLDYKGTGEITARQSVGGLVAGLLGSKMGAGGRITFPFTLTGTLAAPRFEAPQSPFLH